MRKLVILCCLLLSAGAARAYDCFPSTWIPTPGTGTPYITVTTDFGYAKLWWCRLPAMTGQVQGKTYWTRQVFAVRNADQNLTQFTAALQRVMAASSPIAQANAEVAAAAVRYPAGSQPDYEYRLLAYRGCLEQQKPINWPAGVTFDTEAQGASKPTIYDADYCGSAPTPPAPVVSWKVAATPVFKTSGTALTGLAGSVPLGTACDCTKSLKVGTGTYCPFVGATAGTVALCKQ